MSNNMFNGTLPTELGRLRQLSHLEVANNYFRGTIPTHLGFLTKLCKPILPFSSSLISSHLQYFQHPAFLCPTTSLPVQSHPSWGFLPHLVSTLLVLSWLQPTISQKAKVNLEMEFNSGLTGTFPLELGGLTALGTWDSRFSYLLLDDVALTHCVSQKPLSHTAQM